MKTAIDETKVGNVVHGTFKIGHVYGFTYVEKKTGVEKRRFGTLYDQKGPSLLFNLDWDGAEKFEGDRFKCFRPDKMQWVEKVSTHEERMAWVESLS